MRILVVAAHPDDEILGGGATFAASARRGDAVHAVVLSEGATSRYESGMQASLEAAGRRAAARIGFASLRFERFPDQRLDTVPLIDLTQRIEALVEEIDPEVVYTHFSGDANADHGLVARAVWTACRPYRCPRLRRLIAFETPSSTEWGHPLDAGPFRPNLFTDVEATLELKLAAFREYESEVRDYPHPRSPRALAERAAFWGSCIGLAAAEPFVILREKA